MKAQSDFALAVFVLLLVLLRIYDYDLRLPICSYGGIFSDFIRLFLIRASLLELEAFKRLKGLH